MLPVFPQCAADILLRCACVIRLPHETADVTTGLHGGRLFRQLAHLLGLSAQCFPCIHNNNNNNNSNNNNRQVLSGSVEWTKLLKLRNGSKMFD